MYFKKTTIKLFYSQLVLALLTLNLPTRALPLDSDLSRCRIDSWSVRDGLASQSINAITQSPDGFLWLATGGGLVRFDGNNFVQYTTKNTPGLQSDSVITTTVDNAGRLWAGGEWSGFGPFVDGKLNDLQPPLAGWATIAALAQASDGAMWAGGFGTGDLYRLPAGSPVRDLQILKGFNDDVVKLMPYGHSSVVALCLNQGPIIADAAGHPHRYPGSGRLPVDMYNCACMSPNGDLWLGMNKSGLARIRKGDVTVYSTAHGLPSNEVHCLLQDGANRIWIGTSNGVSSWDGKQFVNFGRTDGLSNAEVRSLFEDREGNLWVGTTTGLNRFASTKILTYTPKIGIRSIHVNGYSALAEAPTSRPNHPVVLCVTAGGLAVIENKQICWVGGAFHQNFDGLTVGNNGRVWLWQVSGKGKLAIAVPFADIHRATLRAGEVPSDTTDKSLLLRYPHVYSKSGFNIAFGSKDCLIACDDKQIMTLFPGGVARTIPKHIGWTFAGSTDNHGFYWLASTDGLWRISKRGDGPATKLSTRLFPSPPKTHFLGIDTIDPDRIWLATDHGLACLSNGKIKLYTTKDGLPINELFQIVQDSNGRLWLGDHAGMWSVRISTIDAYDQHRIPKINVEEYGAADGVRDYPTAFSALRTADGVVWMTGAETIMTADPKHMPTNTLKPQVSVVSAEVDGRGISGLSNRIPPGKGSFRVHFAALTFAAPERVRYGYRLIGLDDRWTYTTDRDASFGNLSPGYYQFQVIASNNDGVWNLTGASVGFTIVPHYYQTWWFKALMCVLFVTAIGALLRYRSARLEMRNRELEEKVSARTKELTESNHELADAKGRLEDAYEELSISNQYIEEAKAELEAQNSELLDTRQTLAEANDRLELLARTDGLTGIRNRRAFNEQLGIEWDQYQRSLTPLSIVLLDVDKFKQYNDTYGHPAGDEVLQRVASIISENARTSDFVARYGGEEFIIIAPDTGPDGAAQLAERMRLAIQSAEWPLREITASFGVSTSTAIVDSGDALVSEADGALYQSKKSGRNRVTHAHALQTASLET